MFAVGCSLSLMRCSRLGIGQQICLGLAKRGCTRLFMVDLGEAGLQQTQEMISKISANVKTTLHTADVSDEASVKAMVSKCVEVYGRLDFACNNAGISMGNIPTTEIDLKTFDRIHNVNFKGVSTRDQAPTSTELLTTISRCRSICARSMKGQPC